MDKKLIKGYVYKLQAWGCLQEISVDIRGEENQLDATEWFIELVICPTCFGHLHVHHQELNLSTDHQ
jgi:hypothetical protein